MDKVRDEFENHRLPSSPMPEFSTMDRWPVEERRIGGSGSTRRQDRATPRADERRAAASAVETDRGRGVEWDD
jgi:hypothetical protein